MQIPEETNRYLHSQRNKCCLLCPSEIFFSGSYQCWQNEWINTLLIGILSVRDERLLSIIDSNVLTLQLRGWRSRERNFLAQRNLVNQGQSNSRWEVPGMTVKALLRTESIQKLETEWPHCFPSGFPSSQQAYTPITMTRVEQRRGEKIWSLPSASSRSLRQ